MAEEHDGRCYRERAPEEGPSLFQAGNLTFQAHHVGWIISGVFTIVACITSFWLIDKHLQWYTNKREQRYIVRLLFMVPLYAVVSLASYFFWNHSTPLLLFRDGYEGIVLASFFYLLLMYISPDEAEQRRVFLEKGLSKKADRIAIAKGEKVQKWVMPLGWVKWKPQDGMYFLQINKWAVLQYAVLRPATTLAAIVLDYIGLYCEASWGFGWGHIYISAIVTVSVTVAMYCLIQLYYAVSAELAPHRPLLKLFAVKAVVFLTFWQATGLSVLTMFDLIKDTKYMTAEDINIGIGALLETFEMMLFAFLHIKAFSYKPYKPDKADVPERTPRFRSLCHAMDFRETFREIWIGTKYMWARFRGKQPNIDSQAMKTSHFAQAFEQNRPSHVDNRRGRAPSEQKEQRSALLEKDDETRHPTLPAIDIHVDRTVEADGERQWLGVGDDYGYGLGYLRREKSESLEVQIQRELAKRGYADEIPGRGHIGRGAEDDGGPGHTRGKRSWWRSLYDRVSQSGHESDEEKRLTASPSRRNRKAHSRHNSRDPARDPQSGQRLLSEFDQNFSDPPPEGLLRNHPNNRFNSARVISGPKDLPEPRHSGEMDMLAPLSVFNDRHSSSKQRRTPRQVQPSTPSSRSGGPPAPSAPYLAPPGRIQRSDSLLGRVFPPNTDTESSQGHASYPSDSGQSLPSVSADGASPSKATPKASLIPGIPRLMPTEPNINMAGQRSTMLSTVHPGEDVPPLRIEVTEPSANPFLDGRAPSVASPGETTPVVAQANQSAASNPALVSPTSPTSPNSSRSSRDPQGLKRSSARVYAKDGTPGNVRRQSMPVPVVGGFDPQVKAPEFSRQRQSSRPISSSRRFSTPAPPAAPMHPNSNRPLVHQSKPSWDMNSQITQPSYSGTRETYKYPTHSAHDAYIPADDRTRYPNFPGLPQSPPNLSRPIRHVSPPSYSNVHMQPSPSRGPANLRPYSTNPNDFFTSYRPPL